MKNDALGSRMKGYEMVSTNTLMRRTPVIIRVDGQHFHTFTSGLEKPFDKIFVPAMIKAATSVAESMQGFKVAYVQSDEVSFLLTDFDTLETQPWFNYEINKLVSTAAAMMTIKFTNWYRHLAMGEFPLDTEGFTLPQKQEAYAARDAALVKIKHLFDSTPTFDARAFNIPREEIANYFLWRAKDWHRNSVQMYARANFSHKQLEFKRLLDMHEMLHSIGKNWTTDLQPVEQNGTFITKKGAMSPGASNFVFDYFVSPAFKSIDALVEATLAVVAKETE